MKRSFLKRKPTKKSKLPKRISVARLRRKLDAVYSTYLRKNGADERGIASCYTCGVKKHWKDLQCGHYISRSYNQLRFDPRNTKIQCVGCNIFKNGNIDEYALKLTEEYGLQILKELAEEKRKIRQFTVQELTDLIKKYTLTH